MQIIDLTTGQPIRALSGFSSAAGTVQLDPVTRTGWTLGLDDTQIQQFSY